MNDESTMNRAKARLAQAQRAWEAAGRPIEGKAAVVEADRAVQRLVEAERRAAREAAEAQSRAAARQERAGAIAEALKEPPPTDDWEIGLCSAAKAQWLGNAPAVAGGYVAVDSVMDDALQQLVSGTPAYLVWPARHGDLGHLSGLAVSRALRAAISADPTGENPCTEHRVGMLRMVEGRR